MTRRNEKEYRPQEAIELIKADRAAQLAPCPSCGSEVIDRHPARSLEPTPAPERITLRCGSCGRSVSYTDRGPIQLR